MPEYSGTTITPADGVQVPAMNGASGGNFVLSALRNYILASKGQANGLASLDGNGKLPAAQLPELADDVIVVASYATLPATGESGKIYITADNNKLYRWDSTASDYVELSVDLSAYATKAELNALSARITNLEQTTKQDEQTVQYPDDGNYSSIMPDGVPARVAKYGEVAGIRGKSRGWNQLVPLDVLTTRDFGGFKITNNNDGSWTLNGTASSNIAEYLTGAINLPIGHKILFGYVNLGSAISGLLMRDQYSFAGTGSLMIWESSVETSAFAVIVGSGTVLNNVKIIPIIRDLTIIFPEGVPATVAECVQKCPDILKYDAYGQSIVDTTVEGVRSVGFNLWDEEWELGDINSNGTPIPSTTHIRSKNFIPVNPLTTYYFKTAGKVMYPFWYDENENFIGSDEFVGTTDATFTTVANVAYIKFVMGSPYGTTYNHDICINISGSLNGTYKPYLEPSTLSLPSPVTLRSAGSVSDTDELNVEVNGEAKRRQTTRTAEINLGDYTFSLVNDNGTAIRFSSDRAIPLGAIGTNNINTFDGGGWRQGIEISSSASVDNILDTRDQYFMINIVKTEFTGSDATAFNSWVQGKKFVYELLTDSVTLSDPIIDNYIEVEAGGTINTIQSQTPVIDNCLDVTYDFIPA